MKKNYKVGDMFTVCLDDGCFCLGVVVLDSGRSDVIVSRFSGTVFFEPPSMADAQKCSAASMPISLRSGDTYIRSNRWKTAGRMPGFNAKDWLPKYFVEGPDLADRYWSIAYDANALEIVSREELSCDQMDRPRNTLYGARAAEIELTTWLRGSDHVDINRSNEA